MENALSDINVLDLTHHVAGPYCTKLLADFGARVIKVEKPGEGDQARKMGPFPGDRAHIEKSGLFLHLNTNKKGITLNLKKETGLKIFKQLVKKADILVENFEPRVLPGLGLSYNQLEDINPGLVKVSISNFGQTGPYRDYKASELVIFGMGPHMLTEGEPGREPLRFPGHKAQYLAGTHAATAAMGAFFGSKATGLGQEVDVSIMECLSSPPEGAARLMAYAFDGIEMERAGYRREGVYPYGYYPCKDGLVLIYGFLPSFWSRIVKWLEMPELLTDPRFIDPVARPENHGEFDAILMPWLMERSLDEVVSSAQAQKIPVTPVYGINEVLDDQQFKYREAFVEIDHPAAGKFIYPGVPFKLPETESGPQSPAPLLSQHTEEILGELGYAEDDLTRFRREGVI